MNTNQVANVYQNEGVYTQSSRSTTKNSELEIQDFFTLLAAQLKNQNMLDPVGETEFMSQMVQFSVLQQMHQMSNRLNSFLSVSYLGKTVIAEQKDSSGASQRIEGVVDKIFFSGSTAKLSVNGILVETENIVEIN